MLDEARAALVATAATVTKTFTDDRVSAVRPPAITATTETAAITKATAGVDWLTGDAVDGTRDTTRLLTAIRMATVTVSQTVADIGAAVPAAGQARLDGTPSAGTVERDAVTAAIAAVADHAELDTLIGWAAAATAVKTSHDSAEAAKAAAAQAAAQAAAAEAARSADDGGGSGAGGSSSGGSSSGGGSPAPGASPSTGTPVGGDGPASNWHPMQTHYDSGTCTGAGGGQFVSYGSTLNLPVGAFDVRFYETPGEGWGSKWSCDTGW